MARLPRIDAVLAWSPVAALVERYGLPRWAVVRAVREEVGRLRQEVAAGLPLGEVGPERVEERARLLIAPSLVPVVNATGVVVHTNLGRAPLSGAALRRVVEIAGGYSNLEFDLQKGGRGTRHGHVARAFADFLGAEDAVVVNNNAAALMLALAALASGREVVVSRGELIEIGGSFRIPEVMHWAGVKLREVGTTNKTRAMDYRNAVNSDTGLLLKVHQANFEMIGFTEDTPIAEFAALGAEMGLPTLMDLGSGALLSDQELTALGMDGEPAVKAVLQAGLDLVAFSGDKLVGGPQAGILAGRADLLAKVRSHPLMRVVRPDKLALSALAATLAQHRDGQALAIPTHQMICARAQELLPKANALHKALCQRAARDLEFAVRQCYSTSGGGSKASSKLASYAVVMRSKERSAAQLAASLRGQSPPVIARVANGALWFDVRTLFRDSDLDHVVRAVRRLGEEEEHE